MTTFVRSIVTELTDLSRADVSQTILQVLMELQMAAAQLDVTDAELRVMWETAVAMRRNETGPDIEGPN
jgi:hypothetical protein